MKRTLTCLSLALAPLASTSGGWFTGAQESEFTGEAISADDILVQTYQLAYSGTEGSWTFDLGVGWAGYDLDYSPVLFGTAEQLSENTRSLNLSLTHKWNREWSGTLRLNAYEGYSDYRSIWIAEFYNQFFGAFPDYYDPDPHGRSAGLTAEWNYLPNSGKAILSFDFGRDEIAPGWSFDSAAGKPAPGRESLDTVAGGVRVEQALNGWLKSELDLTIRQTSEREPRYGIRNSWVAAAGPVALRLTAGYTEESPSFDATYGSALVEWDFFPEWSAFVGYRIYADSGEIESSGFNALAPALDSTEIFAGLLWDRGDLAISGGVGFLETDYEPLSEDNKFFGNLYRDREWLTFRLAASFRF